MSPSFAFDREAARLTKPILPRLEAMAREVIDFWRMHGPDPVHGGFHGYLDRRGRATELDHKGLVQQSRHLWTFSAWFERREPSAATRALADSLYHFLVERMLDRRDGEFFYLVGRAGEVLNPKKLLYAEAFAIYGLSTYGRVFDDTSALDRALRCFSSIDSRTHDAVRGGYDQRTDVGWLAPGACKNTNTHIHLMEGFTALLDATGETTVAARVRELVGICAHRLLQPTDYVHADFDVEFRPIGTPVTSYGHDLETAWLMLDACRSLGEWPESVLAAARRMGIHSAERGFDRDRGGYFYAGPPGKAPDQLEKVWWVQFEALPGLWWVYRMTGDHGYLERLERTLHWLETEQHDAEYGEWFYGINPDGSVGPHGDHKAELWKASYHQLRGLVYAADWVREMLARNADRPLEGLPES